MMTEKKERLMNIALVCGQIIFMLEMIGVAVWKREVLNSAATFDNLIIALGFTFLLLGVMVSFINLFTKNEKLREGYFGIAAMLVCDLAGVIAIFMTLI